MKTEIPCDSCGEKPFVLDEKGAGVFAIKRGAHHVLFCCPECAEKLREESPRSEIL